MLRFDKSDVYMIKTFKTMHIPRKIFVLLKHHCIPTREKSGYWNWLIGLYNNAIGK